MRIVDFKEFATLPVGTIFAEYISHILSEPYIKTESFINDGTLESYNYYESNFLITPDCDSGFDHDDTSHRGGTGNVEQQYLIYEDEDVDKMIELIKTRFKD